MTTTPSPQPPADAPLTQEELDKLKALRTPAIFLGGGILLILLALVAYKFFHKITGFYVGLMVYEQGQLIPPTQSPFTTVDPCNEQKLGNDPGLGRGHVHDTESHIVHVRRTDAVWGDILKNLGYQTSGMSKFTAYINGTRIVDDKKFLNIAVAPGDSVVAFYGDNGKIKVTEKVQEAVTKGALQDAEKQVQEKCGK